LHVSAGLFYLKQTQGCLRFGANKKDR